ncbi:hypothetical protein DK26_09245 [Bosea sp. WAO]|uniref:TlpA disulfide reductase family protein n=1 Tax=Bosea sp. WAO TaxID=406341 RepID=UPI0007488918|nr:TlpA disulfide reductase family protein [Bosea sp. WAO]KUL95351.1 hypothetical protein DK26_09245 [Bosea sp. WAO]
MPTSPTRRLALQTLLGGLAIPAFAGERPPVFRTSRYQFRELDPIVTMTALKLARLDGKPALANPTSGKVTLIYLWATWCPVCRVELPRFERQLAQLRQDGVDLLTIATDEREPAYVRAYLARLGVKQLPVFLDHGGKRLSAQREDGSESPFSLAEGQPITYAVDPNGGVRGYLLGEADWSSPQAQALLGYFARA